MNENDEALLERYLDGLLDAREKAAFEERLTGDPELKRQVELQKRIDGAVARSVPAQPEARALLEKARGAKIVKPAFGRRALVTAVSLAAAVLLAVLVWQYVFVEEPTHQPRRPHRTFEQAYAETAKAGFKPEWVCKDEAEFVASYKKAVGEPLRLAKLDEKVQAVGLAYFDTLSPWTIALLARVEGKEVIVFADPANYDNSPTLEAGSTLHLHRRQIGKVVLYELSPFAEPRVLPAFEKAP